MNLNMSRRNMYITWCTESSALTASLLYWKSGGRLEERFKDHKGRDKSSHILKHTMESGHTTR